jgi:hypothetical protein
MTISTTVNKVIGQGNGATTAFSYSFLMPSAANAVVTFTDAFGNQTVLSPSQYSLSGVGNPNGGTLNYPLSGSPMSAGQSITLQRILPFQQLTSLVNQSGFYPAVVEAAMDSLEMQIQQLGATANGNVSLQYPAIDSGGLNAILPAAALRANKLVSFDALGNVVAIAAAAQSATQVYLDLAAATGAGLVNYNGSTLAALMLAGVKHVVGSIAQLRAVLKTQYAEAFSTGYYAQGDGGGGTYYYDSSDTTSTDNGGTVIVASDGGRWKLANTAGSLNVKQFGAKGDGTTDDTAAIQAAINALTNGGEVLFPQATYKVSSTISIGNGSSAAASTIWGITLRGLGHPVLPAAMISGFPSTGGVKILWSGGSTPMFNILGPLNGWGIQNMYLDGASLATRGINVLSASFGQSSNLALSNFTDTAIYETTLASYVGFGLADSMHNHWSAISIAVPAVAGAKGIVLTGVPTASPQATNACYEQFTNILIFLPTTLTTYGVYLQWADSNVFQDLHIFGGSVTAVCIELDYTVQANLPSGNCFIGLDPSGTGSNIQFGQAGTPNSGARPNRILALSEINNAVQPNQPNLIADLPTLQTKLSLTGQTAAIGTTGLFTPYVSGIYRVSYYMTMTAGGTAGTLQLFVNYNDGFTLKSDASGSINANGSAPLSTNGVFVMQAAAGVQLSFNVNFTGVTGAPVYALYLVAERIG